VLNETLIEQTQAINLEFQTQTSEIVNALAGVETAVSNIVIPAPAPPIFITPPKDPIAAPVTVDPNSAKQLEATQTQNALLSEILKENKTQSNLSGRSNEINEILEMRMAESNSKNENRKRA
jgi:hypothetical protein